MRSYLSDCQKVEAIMGEVYRKLSGVKSYSERLRGIFQRLARDEEQHVEHFEIAKSIPSDVFYRDMAVPPQQIDKLRRRANLLLRKAEHPPRSESTILEGVRKMEQEFMDVHQHNAERLRETEFADLFRELCKEDEEHLEALHTYLENKASHRSWH